MDKSKLCKDCKYMIEPSLFEKLIAGTKHALKFARCSHPEAEWKKDYVNGDGEFTFCALMRELDFHCGKEGKFWTPKS